MLVANDTNGSRKVASIHIRNSEFFCPDCMQAVRIKAGGKLIAHFAHLKGQDCTKAQKDAKTKREAARKSALREKAMAKGQGVLFEKEELAALIKDQ